jgi:ATP-binding cassette, subfamily B, bacterial
MGDARLTRLGALFALAYAFDYALFVLSWWFLGRGVLETPIDPRYVYAWALTLASMLPFRILSTWSAGAFAVSAGELLKKRLLKGAMKLDPDELRSDGAGRHLSRVFESEAVETLALTGGLLSFAASIEILVALGIVALGARAVLEGVLLATMVLALGILTHRYFEERRRWTSQRLSMTHDLVEKMVGYRTRLAQEPPERWHTDEEEALASYGKLSERVDRLYSWIQALPRIWLPLGALGLAAGRPDLDRLAIGLGGAILAARALAKLADGFSDLVDAAIAWERVGPLFRAAERPPVLVEAAPTSNGRPLVRARNLSFIYPRRSRAVLNAIGFDLERGDRVLLTSPSGGGKSTLVSLLNGLRKSSEGTLFLDGRVATAPQFHENHVFTESFSFNLLMARRWPPSGDDKREGEELCRALGLGELLEKMPGGMNQMVGDTGWQLSHGEKSRLYLARALLQGSELVILDESFAALDPENLLQALQTARERAPTLVVVAHV